MLTKIVNAWLMERSFSKLPSSSNKTCVLTKLQKEKNISNYRIYKDLELNPGNINAYLKHGDPSKLSLATARKTLDYLEAV